MERRADASRPLAVAALLLGIQERRAKRTLRKAARLPLQLVGMGGSHRDVEYALRAHGRRTLVELRGQARDTARTGWAKTTREPEPGPMVWRRGIDEQKAARAADSLRRAMGSRAPNLSRGRRGERDRAGLGRHRTRRRPHGNDRDGRGLQRRDRGDGGRRRRAWPRRLANMGGDPRHANLSGVRGPRGVEHDAARPIPRASATASTLPVLFEHLDHRSGRHRGLTPPHEAT